MHYDRLIDPRNKIGITEAVRNGFTSIVKKLVEKDPSCANHVVKSETYSSQFREWSSPAEYEKCESMLELAIERGWVDIVKVLLDAGADPNYKSWDGTYSVMGACKKYGNAKILQMLVEAGGIDDGTPLRQEKVRRTTQEELYGRCGNFTANFFDRISNRLDKARKRQYEAAARTMADRDCYRLLDKILSLFKCSSMAEFVRFHEVYVSRIGDIAREDLEFIMNSTFSRGIYCETERMDIGDQLQFIQTAVEHGLDGKGKCPEPSETATPVLREFVKKEFGELYIDGEPQALANLHDRLYEKYKGLFPKEDIERHTPGWLDQNGEDEEYFKEEAKRFTAMDPGLKYLRRDLCGSAESFGVESGNSTVW